METKTIHQLLSTSFIACALLPCKVDASDPHLKKGGSHMAQDQEKNKSLTNQVIDKAKSVASTIGKVLHLTDRSSLNEKADQFENLQKDYEDFLRNRYKNCQHTHIGDCESVHIERREIEERIGKEGYHLLTLFEKELIDQEHKIQELREKETQEKPHHKISEEISLCQKQADIIKKNICWVIDILKKRANLIYDHIHSDHYYTNES